jgi:hypothetical protein
VKQYVTQVTGGADGMSRARGKNTPRDPLGELIADLKNMAGLGEHDPGADPGVRREEGIGEPRDIPGGLNHLANPPVTHGPVPTPVQEWPFRRSDLAHGVPPDEAGRQDRDPRLTGGQRGKARMAPPEAPRATPVPVYIVEGEGGGGVIRTVSPRSIQLSAAGTFPTRVCGKNQHRVEVQLLNEDTATDIRFGVGVGGLTGGLGALLPWPSNSYLTVKTQDELWAIGATGSGTPRLSVIEVFEEQAGG